MSEYTGTLDILCLLTLVMDFPLRLSYVCCGSPQAAMLTYDSNVCQCNSRTTLPGERTHHMHLRRGILLTPSIAPPANHGFRGFAPRLVVKPASGFRRTFVQRFHEPGAYFLELAIAMIKRIAALNGSLQPGERPVALDLHRGGAGEDEASLALLAGIEFVDARVELENFVLRDALAAV